MISLFNAIEKESQSLVKGPYTFILEKDDHISENVTFPCICKSLEAGGSENSHHMGIVFNTQSLLEWPRPVLVQQYYNHNCTIDKVFVIGDQSFVVRRPSLLNYEMVETNAPVIFNSQKMDDFLGNPENFDVPVIPKNTIEKITASVIKGTNLHLLGYDVITDNKTGQYYIIDINFFPGFKGIDKFNEIFFDFVCKKIAPSRRKGSNKSGSRIKVMDLPWKINRAYVEDLCSKFGNIKKIEMRRGDYGMIALVTFTQQVDAEYAMYRLDGYIFMGYEIYALPAPLTDEEIENTKKEREERQKFLDEKKKEKSS